MRRIVLTMISAVLILGISAAVYYFSPGPLETQTTVILPHGKGFITASDQLRDAHIIRLPLWFKAMAAVTGQARKIKAGEYMFPPHVTPHDVLDMLTEGRTVKRKFTMAEGLSALEISKLLMAEPALTGDIPMLKEGELLPETYYFAYGDTRAEILGRMQKAMAETLASAWGKRRKDLPLTSPQDALILASIVEKETGVPEERGRVAAVFINRLRQGMLLQTDPTVAYGIEMRTGKKLDRALTIKDLETPTPYNTYMNAGLPPGPICNPGKATLAATLNPPESDELYFVATGSGGHHFARTVEEHNKNVAAYRATLKANNKKNTVKQ